MKIFLWNILLAIVWASLFADFSIFILGSGFLIGFLILWFAQQMMPPAELIATARKIDFLGAAPSLVQPANYFTKVQRSLDFFFFFIWALILSNFRVAYSILFPKGHINPGIVSVPLDVQSDEEITLLANAITLTPGTLTVNISPDRKILYVHTLFLDDPDTFRKEIKHDFERRIQGIFE